VNGAALAISNNITLSPSSMGVTTNNWLGRSEFSNPYLSGVLEEFRIYNVALSSAEIAATDAMGTSQLLSAGNPSISLTMTDTNLTFSWPLPYAGFALQSSTNLVLGNWQTAASPAPQIVTNQWQVSLPIPSSSPSIFYRLVK
jgi:hypothetical protein